MRPSHSGLAERSALLDFKDYPEIFDEWLPEATPGRKRKLGQRRDDLPTPPCPRQPPPIVPRGILPQRDINVPLRGGSLNTSPYENENGKQKNNKKEHSFNVLLPIETNNEIKQQHIRTPHKIIEKENSSGNIINRNKKGVRNERKLVHALTRHHPGFPSSKLLPHHTTINFLPQANNKTEMFKTTEIRVLNLRSNYVPPAPEQVLKRLPKEIEQMKEKISTAWRRTTKTIEREPLIVRKFCDRIEEEIKKTVATEMTKKDDTMKQAITTFKKIQKENNIIFRKTDKSKVFHIDTSENYIRKSAAYMEKTNAYIEIRTSPLREMIDKTDKFLRDLVSSKKVSQYMLERLRPSNSDSELPHLYYNPKDHKIGESLRPIVSGMKSPLTKISTFLDQNIRPIFDHPTPYSLPNSMIFLKHLKDYITTSETAMYTFDITDLYTMIPQKESVLAVCEFVGRHGYKKVRGLSINTIKALFLHALENCHFVLQLPGIGPKYYRHIKGGAMGSACTQVSVDIYVRKWENDFLQEQKQQKELYFRFRDDVFITTKLTSEQIERRLTELNAKDPNIKITWEGGKAVDYLDVTTTIEIPNFKTTVFRKLAAQPYVLPFHSSHPKHITRHIPYAAALRATRICSH
ncbi:unnamed protein product [Rotaria magnacalcarata]|uniref:Reverse transcriptase domain-containing protein n=1 Tax=Rotaria magnacalcarata TaxID=392030 RepID=A0A819VT20_9BILA|nr:unnamed protein product [Rotaria magnacalcarata]